MFTGLIRHLGELKARDARGIAVACPSLRTKLAEGDSVAVNGACLTVTELTGDGFRADLLEDTRRNTTLGELPTGARLNLETALTAEDAFGGHFVQGHVDGIVHVTARRELPSGDWRLSFELAEWLKPHVVDRGSIAIDGVSLTVQEIEPHGSPPAFSVSIIPTTWNETNLGGLSIGCKVNIEADLLIKAARHSIEQILGKDEMLTAEKLREWGYGGKSG
jgi:riboflavin synthase